MSNEKYQRYAFSGFDWLGDLPSQWKLLKGQFVFKVINERSANGEEMLLSVSEKKGVTPRSEADVTMFLAESYEGYKMCKPGDLVINSLWAWSNGLGFSRYEGIVSTAYSVYRPDHNRFDYRYLHYLLKTERYVGQYLVNSKGIWTSRLQLSDWSFLRIPIVSPPKEEQTEIADFLEKKTREIREFISLKEKTIELLKERKAAIINQAVTKGLDPNVEMKDSGIDWLGKIPKHWEVRKLKHKLRYITGGGTPAMDNQNYWDGNIPWISPKDMKVKWISDTQLYVTPNALRNTNLKLLPKGSLLIVVRSGILQRTLPVCMTSVEATINQDLKALVAKKDLNSEYLYHLLKGCENTILYSCVKSVATVESIEMEYFKNFSFPFAPSQEQTIIVDFINKTTIAIDHVIKHIEKEIEFTRQFEKSLIAEAVTGKIDIREQVLNAI